MANTIAKIAGTALQPGVSRNGRLYTREIIARAVERAQGRIAAGDQPMTMLTHHAAADASTHIVGRLTSMSVAEDGSARYTAVLGDTDHARNILNLIDTTGGDPILKGVSIRGQWLGPVQRKTVDGQTVETGEDLELHGLDFTKEPGVPGAQVDSVARTGGPREATENSLIFESVDAVEITEDVDEAKKSKAKDGDEEDDATEKGAPALKSGKPAKAQTKAPKGSYADPGYQDDKMPRYPIDTKAHAKAAWSYINQKDNADDYTAAQLKQIKSRIKAALKKFGVKVEADEGWIAEPAAVVTEVMAMCPCGCGCDYGGSAPRGSVSLTLDNGVFTVCIYSYQIDPCDLDVIGRAAMSAACDAVCAIDPDMDGDMDVPGADGEDTDHDMESVESAAESLSIETPAADTATGDTTEAKEPAEMAEPTENAAAPAAEAQEPAPAAMPAVTLSGEQFAQLLAALQPKPAAAPAESAPEGDATESAPAAPVEETQEQLIQRLVAEGIQKGLTKAVQEHVEANGVQRKGLVQTQESAPAGGGAREFDYPDGWPQKPLHEYSREEQKKFWNPQVEGAVMGRHSAFRDDDAA